MNLVSSNIKHLRKQKSWTQQDLADRLEIKRSLIGSYEEGRADPRISTLLKIAEVFNLSMDDLISQDLTQYNRPQKSAKILAITVDSQEKENIELVPQKAAAGYTNGYADPEYLQDLPRFQLPNLPKDRTYRAFEISGDSMLPIQPGTIIIGQYLEHASDVKNGNTYVIVSEQEGVVYKRAFNYINEKSLLYLVSDNTLYAPYELNASGILEIWEAKAYISTQFPQANPDSGSQLSMQELTQMVMDIKAEVTKLKK